MSSKRQQFRGRLYELREHARRGAGEVPQRISDCGRVRHDDHVTVIRRGSGDDASAGFGGVVTCRSVWECPVCRAKICAERAQEISRTVEAWHREHGPTPEGHYRVLMLTLTIRHRRGERLADLGGAIIDARRRMWQGASWKRWRDRWGAQYIAGWETTYGDSAGWHPHLHVLFLLGTPMSEDDYYRESDWITERWMRVVAEVIDGRRGWTIDDPPTPHMPDTVHGSLLLPCVAEEYIAKLGLELQDGGTKSGGRGVKERVPASEDAERYTPLELLAAHRDGRREDGLEKWREYCAAMRGRRQLTWSHGLRGVRERVRDEIAAEEEAAEEAAVVVAGIDGDRWDVLRGLTLDRTVDGDESRYVMTVRRRWDGGVVHVVEVRDPGWWRAVVAAATDGPVVDARHVILTCAEREPSSVCGIIGAIVDGQVRSDGASVIDAAMWADYHSG